MTKALVPLPLFSTESKQDALSAWRVEPAAQGRIKAVWIERQGSLLHPTALAEGDDVLGLNLARGCMHRCAFCSVRAVPNHSPERLFQMYAGTPERLARELSSRRRKPRAVFLSPSGDPFPPLLTLQKETVRVVQVLARHDVQAWLMTRGYIRPATMDALAAVRQHVKITVGLTTVDRELQYALEPLAAPPRLRLRQIRELRERGFAVQVALEPLIPGTTDTRKNLAAVLEALAALGVPHVSTSYLFLRPGIRDNLLAALERHGIPDTVSEEFASGPILTAPGLSPARYLPRARRQRGYAAVMALAAERGLTVSISSVTNPDLPAARTTSAETAARQRLLPMFAAASPAN